MTSAEKRSRARRRAACAQRGAAGRVGDQGLHGPGERGGVAGGDEDARDAVLHDLGDAADARRDARAAEAHRLEDAQAEALGIRREQPQVGRLQVVLDVE